METQSRIPPLQTIATLDVDGMRCAGCVQTVEQRLIQHPGVIAATVNWVTKLAVVEYEPAIATPANLAGILTEAGFPSQPRQGTTTKVLQQRQELEKREFTTQIQRLVFASLLLCFSTLGHIANFFGLDLVLLSNIWFHAGLATLSMVGPGRFMLINGWRGLRNNAPTMDTLIGLGIVTAYTASMVALFFPKLGWDCFFDEPVMLIGFILLGQTLEHRARTRSRAALHHLMTLLPSTVHLVLQSHPINIKTQSTLDIPTEQVQVGDWLQVMPGEKIPVDGELIDGKTTIDESWITGESVSVGKQPGDGVIAGTFNQSGLITIRATRIGEETTLAQIISLVETAQTRKAPIQGIADWVAGKFTYIVMTIAFLTFLFWYGIGTHLWPQLWESASSMGHHQLPSSTGSPLLFSLKLAIAVLVVACPCALGLATPTAILVGSGIGAARGLLIRGGDVLESVHNLTTIIFDKTGTLTLPVPRLTDYIPTTGDFSPSSLLQLAATVESGTYHPFAAAIQQQATAEGITLLPARNFYTAPGEGVSALVDLNSTAGEQRVLVGTVPWLQSEGVIIPAEAIIQADLLVHANKSITFLAVNHQLAGLLAISHDLRADAQSTIAILQKSGLNVMIMTGDQEVPAQAVANQLGLTNTQVLANVRPDEKAAVIARLQQAGERVGMVGDGINDGPALAQADVGIALHSGTDVAVESSQIVLMGDRLQDVVSAIWLSRSIFNKIRQNLFWAMTYNIIGIPIAAGVLLPSWGIVLNPATAGALMAFSSISVVVNSLTLRME